MHLPGRPAPHVNTPLPVVHGERVCTFAARPHLASTHLPVVHGECVCTWAAPTRAALPAREIPPCMSAALAESVVAVPLEWAAEAFKDGLHAVGSARGRTDRAVVLSYVGRLACGLRGRGGSALPGIGCVRAVYVGAASGSWGCTALDGAAPTRESDPPAAPPPGWQARGQPPSAGSSQEKGQRQVSS